MRHHDKNKKLGREKNQRNALMRSLARSLALHGRIKTTLAKAKAARPLVEKMLTRAKRGGLSDRRMLAAAIGDAATKSLVAAGERHAARQGGYLRIVKLGARKGDAAEMALVEFV